MTLCRLCNNLRGKDIYEHDGLEGLDRELEFDDLQASHGKGCHFCGFIIRIVDSLHDTSDARASRGSPVHVLSGGKLNAGDAFVYQDLRGGIVQWMRKLPLPQFHSFIVSVI